MPPSSSSEDLAAGMAEAEAAAGEPAAPVQSARRPGRRYLQRNQESFRTARNKREARKKKHGRGSGFLNPAHTWFRSSHGLQVAAAILPCQLPHHPPHDGRDDDSPSSYSPSACPSCPCAWGPGRPCLNTLSSLLLPRRGVQGSGRTRRNGRGERCCNNDEGDDAL